MNTYDLKRRLEIVTYGQTLALMLEDAGYELTGERPLKAAAMVRELWEIPLNLICLNGKQLERTRILVLYRYGSIEERPEWAWN